MLYGRIKNWLAIHRWDWGRRLDRRRLRNRTFTLFSNDCWGAEVYKHFDLPFNTPFIGLMLMAPCYLRFLERPRHYLGLSLRFVAASRYPSINELRAGWEYPFPLAVLGERPDEEIEIQFLHYHSEAEAQEKWTRRAKRVNWDNLFIKFDGSKDFATPELVRRFAALPQPKLLLLREPQADVEAITVVQYTLDGMLQFVRSLPHYDLVNWLNQRQIKLPLVRRLVTKLLFPAAR